MLKTKLRNLKSHISYISYIINYVLKFRFSMIHVLQELGY